MNKINEIIEKIKNRDLEFNDVFPLNDCMFTPQNAAKVLGIYVGIIILCILINVLLGGIFILGVILKIITGIAIAYSVIGIVAFMLVFMKYNN